MQIRSSYMDRESGKRHGCVGNGMKKKREREKRKRGGEGKKKRKKSGTRKVTFSKPQRVFTELADLPLEKCWGLPRCVAT